MLLCVRTALQRSGGKRPGLLAKWRDIPTVAWKKAVKAAQDDGGVAMESEELLRAASTVTSGVEMESDLDVAKLGKRGKGENAPASPVAKRAKKTLAERDAGKTVFPQDPLDRRKVPSEGNLFKVLSWNVNGLRAIVRNHKEKLLSLVQEEQPDLLFLQETKLQEQHVSEVSGLIPGYDAHFSCSVKKKGYAGTAVFVKQGCPYNHEISFEVEPEKHQGEGRAVVLEMPFANIVALYVPNSGEKLQRLEYRTQEWDKDLRLFLQKLQKSTGNENIVCGDLNVAHRDLDVWNPRAPHIRKTAGSTPEERRSFSEFLEEEQYVDLFRHFYGEVSGHFTYWSLRARGRPFNRGNRLDYFCLPQSALEQGGKFTVHDTFILDKATIGASDHCPIGCVLEIHS